MEGFERSDSGAYVASFEAGDSAADVAALAADEAGLELVGMHTPDNGGETSYTYSKRFPGVGNSVLVKVNGANVRVEATHAPIAEPSAKAQETAQLVRIAMADLME